MECFCSGWTHMGLQVPPGLTCSTHYFTSWTGSEYQWLRGSHSLPPTHPPTSLRHRWERGAKKKSLETRVDIQNAHFTQDPCGEPNEYLNPVNITSRERKFVDLLRPHDGLIVLFFLPFFKLLGNVPLSKHVHSLLGKGYIKPGAESWRYGVFSGRFLADGLLQPADLLLLLLLFLLHAGPPEAGASPGHVLSRRRLAVRRGPPRVPGSQRQQCTQLRLQLLWEIPLRCGHSQGWEIRRVRGETQKRWVDAEDTLVCFVGLWQGPHTCCVS